MEQRYTRRCLKCGKLIAIIDPEEGQIVVCPDCGTKHRIHKTPMLAPIDTFDEFEEVGKGWK